MLGLLPAGASLTELELAAHFSCSQGTVREALLQLQEEGLVRRQGHRGTQVSECTEAEAVEMFRVRQQIECNGIVRTLQAPSRTLVSDLKALLVTVAIVFQSAVIFVVGAIRTRVFAVPLKAFRGIFNDIPIAGHITVGISGSVTALQCDA